MRSTTQLEFMQSPTTDGPTAERRVVRADAFEWLAGNPAEPGTSVVTSLPDRSELPRLEFEAWRGFFVAAARAVLEWIPEDGVAMFHQSDIRFRGAWIDKSYLVQRAADELGATLVFHKIVCRAPPGTPSNGRASYSHLLCFSKRSRFVPSVPGPDVLADAGYMSWSKATGERACALACRFLIDETETRVVVDPFCGRGTVLAVANAFGFSAIGVDSSARACRAARRLVARMVDVAF
ncbi:MAG TPA: hypothetical protein VF103_01015 [Polyangiaceae bacterium]